MAGDDRVLLLGGEAYIDSPNPVRGAPSAKRYPWSYEEAREQLIEDIDVLSDRIGQIREDKRVDRVLVCFRLFPEFLAKSYDLALLLHCSQGLKSVGSRYWEYDHRRKLPDYRPRYTLSRLFFVEADSDGLMSLRRVLRSGETTLSEEFKNEARRVCGIDLLQASEKTGGFPPDWAQGRIELVLHSLDDPEGVKSKLKSLGLDRNGDVHYAIYPTGLLFASLRITRERLESILDFNPLRACHPLPPPSLAPVRVFGTQTTRLAKPVGSVPKSSIGMFDGGVDTSHPLLRPYVDNIDLVKTPVNDKLQEHGTAVAGALIYGSLDPGAAALVPSTKVRSFRVLPPPNPHDEDLYDVIDLIEETIPKHPDIRVWNLSFGPPGPILDDPISRFTYSLDFLVQKHGFTVLPINAAGNDGDKPHPLNRIQSPSDMVNGLGVGAFDIATDGVRRRASYSCVGPGREGCKVKPDVVAFGGCSLAPFQVLTRDPDQVAQVAGTSFAAPLVSRLAQDLLNWCEGLDPLMARALIIHTAVHPLSQVPDVQLGHGIIRSTKEDVYRCSRDSVTVVSCIKLAPASFAQLPLFIPDLSDYRGNVDLTWTTVVGAPIDPSASDSYTSACVETTFYPNIRKFPFLLYAHRRVVGRRCLDVRYDSEQVKQLTDKGWHQASRPLARTGRRFRVEHERRDELKWDSVVRRTCRLRASSLSEPVLVLHGIARNGFTKEFRCVVVVTVRVAHYPDDLYAKVRERYSNLVPLRIRLENEVLVRV